MKVVIACGAMNFGPNTPMLASLGGSETAALMLAKELAGRGHEVNMFCNLPAAGASDFFAGGLADDGVTYADLRTKYGDYVAQTPHDLTIIVRDPNIATLVSKGAKKVLWAHDIFTKKGMGSAIDQMGFCWDEIWTVSEWHRQQIHEATDYPLTSIKALRNGIVRYADIERGGALKREKHNLVYAARPERGLDNLIMPGGVMDNLPDMELHVFMYEHFPEHMRAYYEGIRARMEAMPNVHFHGGKPNKELRRLIGEATAYIYPTQFEETSCILAREALEQGTPFITTRVGALPETLGKDGLFFEDWLQRRSITEAPKGTPEWCAQFATFFEFTLAHNMPVEFGADRTDLYWDGVAELVEKYSVGPAPQQTCGAAIIAYNNEDTIIKCLNSLVGNVDQISVAHGPSTDATALLIQHFASKHPEIAVTVRDVPKIEAYKYGFDHARNDSVAPLTTDWVLWIDTDEFLVGNIRKYLRPNHLQSYMICQHHFTVEPRGAAVQIDRPARLFRLDQGFTARGHIHEHFEVEAGGPGRSWLLPDVDIGHTGYENEAVRQGRFHRNFPFLEWEHSEPEQRKLNHFLWLRDLIHRMRFAVQQQNRPEAIKLAQEAVSYYNEHYEAMSAFGPGIFMALQYVGEAKTVLGIGFPIKIAIQLEEGKNATFQGKFSNYSEVERVFKQILEPEFKDRSKKYHG